MSDELPAPYWADRMFEPPIITRYAGPAAEAVGWHGRWDRTRFQVNVATGAPAGLELGPGPQVLDVSIQQAAAIVEMLSAALSAQALGVRPVIIRA
jgi:hypothetical protein